MTSAADEKSLKHIEPDDGADRDDDPWFEDDLEPLELGGVIWKPLAKRIAAAAAAIVAIAAIIHFVT